MSDSHRSRRKYFLFAILLFSGILAWDILLHHYNPFLFDSRIQDKERGFSIKQGDTAKSITKRLFEQKIIASETWFLIYLSVKGWGTDLKYGKYHFFPGDRPIDIAKKIHLGEVVEYRISIIEGWRFRDLRKKLSQSQFLKNTIEGQSNQQVAERLGIDEAYLDGAFFPNTYHYNEGVTDIEILKRAYDTMNLFFNQALLSYQNRPLSYSAFSTWTKSIQDQYKILSLAAIIEKETFVDEEYPLISSVFHNRLIKDMRLQADPTVIYAQGEDFKGRIRTKHLRFKSPYNTYTTKGLPPFPIAYASGKAIKAAFNPAKTDYIYFVAKGNGREHVFNADLEDHNKAVDKYWKIIESRKKRKK